MGLSKISERCRKCPFVGTCDHKQMEAFACLPKPDIALPLTQPIGAAMIAPVLRGTTEIRINGEKLTVYKDELEKEIYKQIYSGICIQGDLK